jgi:hypothetical protein
MSWIDKLKTRWNVSSVFQVIIILVVFACTGLTVLFLKRPLFQFLFDDGNIPLWATLIYYILILPVYNVILLFYGFVFGQFRFFWNFETRLLSRLSRNPFRKKDFLTKK